MASMTTSPLPAPPPPSSSQHPQEKAASNPPTLPPLVTNPPLRRTPSNRPTSFAQRTISNYSSSSRFNHSRPLSEVFPAFHSSLSYTFVRDFAYPSSHPLHYGPQPDASGAATPASEASRRLSDPAMMGWEDSRSQWSATAPFIADTNYGSNRDQLPAMTFNDGGPPYSEDEDIRSPIVTSKNRHRKKKSNAGERGRSPGAASQDRGMIMDVNGDQLEEYRPMDTDEMDGPGGEIETYSRPRREPYHRDSNFAKPLQRTRPPYDCIQPSPNETDPRAEAEDADDDDDEMDDNDTENEEGEDGEDMDEDAARFSKDYSFTIASPDEEMNGKAVVLFDFEPEHENELGLYEGQIILVSYRQARGWLVAEDPATGESGLVPETYVRLVSQIDGGLNGLQAFESEDNGNGTSYTSQDVMSPISHEPSSAISVTQDDPKEILMGGHTPRPSNGGSFSSEKHPAVQSTFSTSSRDFSPLKREAGGRSPERD